MFRETIETPDYIIPPILTSTRAAEPSKTSEKELPQSEDTRERTIRGTRKDDKPLQPPSSKFLYIPLILTSIITF